MNVSEPDVSIANSADLEEEEDLARRNGERVIRPTASKAREAFRPRSIPGGGDDDGLRVGRSQTEMYVRDNPTRNFEEDGDGLPTDAKGIAWHNMMAVVEEQKEGPWYT